jgi:hypothetical protein
MLLATTIDREWTDLPIHPGFLPLIQESARRLTGASEDRGHLSLVVGQPRELTLARDERRIEVIKPDGSLWIARQDRGEQHKTVLFTETDQPGAYRVRSAGGDGALSPRAADSFVVNLDPRESDLSRLSPERRPDRLARTASGEAAAPKRRVELWHGLAGIVIMVVLLESLLTVRWRRSVIVENS